MALFIIKRTSPRVSRSKTENEAFCAFCFNIELYQVELGFWEMPFFEKMLKFFFQKSVQEAWFIYYILRPLHPPIVKIFFFGCFPGHLAFCFNTGLYLSAFCFNTGSENGLGNSQKKIF